MRRGWSAPAAGPTCSRNVSTASGVRSRRSVQHSRAERVLGFHVDAVQIRVVHLLDHVDGHGCGFAQRPDQGFALGRVARPRDRDPGPEAAAQGLRDLRDRRQAQHREHAAHLVRDRAGPVRPGPQQGLRVLGGVVDRAAVEPGQWQQFGDERGDDAHVALAAAQRPEQFRFVPGVRLAQVPVRGDHLEGADQVGGVAVGPAEDRESAAEGVADDARVRGGAAQARQAVGGGRGHDVAPLRARGDGGGAGRGVHVHVRHAGRVDQQAVLDREVGAVAGGLDGDGGVGGVCPAHGGDDVVGAGGAYGHVGGVQGGQVEAGYLVGVGAFAGA